MQRFLNEIVYIDKKYKTIKADSSKPNFCCQCAFNVPAFCIKSKWPVQAHACHPNLVYKDLTT